MTDQHCYIPGRREEEIAEHYRYLIERFERKIALYKNRVGE